MTTRKTHDADLCERIRELEKRIEELERRPAPYWVGPWWGVNPPYWISPWLPNTSGSGTWTAPPNTTITYGVTTSDVVTADSGIQPTFTGTVVS